MDQWDEISEARINEKVTARCYRSTNARINRKYSLGIFFFSNEPRSKEFLTMLARGSLERAIVVHFSECCGKTDTDLVELVKQIQEITVGEVTLISDMEICDVRKTADKILSCINSDDLFPQKRVFMEMTAPPLVYTLSIVGFLNSLFPFPSIDFLSVSAVYSEPESFFCFSEGTLEDIYIPFFEGKYNWSHPSLSLFMLGFEGHRSLGLFRSNEPRTVEALIASPGYTDGYENLALAKNNLFLKEAGISQEDVNRVDIGDAVGVFNKIKEIKAKSGEANQNFSIILLGPKPHALGAGLYGIFDRSASLVYEVPNKYSQGKSTKRGRFVWLYELTTGEEK